MLDRVFGGPLGEALPVGNGCERHPCSSGLERPDLGGVYPCDGSESEGVDKDEDVTERNHSVGW